MILIRKAESLSIISLVDAISRETCCACVIYPRKILQWHIIFHHKNSGNSLKWFPLKCLIQCIRTTPKLLLSFMGFSRISKWQLGEAFFNYGCSSSTKKEVIHTRGDIVNFTLTVCRR